MSASRTHRPLTVVALMLSLFLAAVETTVVTTAMPSVVAELHGLELYGWVFTSYLLAATVTAPIHGKLADLYGRKPVLLVGLALFLVGSVLAGQATGMVALIAFRALQGVGAGAIQPVAMTVIGDLFDLAERARVQGAFGAVWGVAGLVGPLAGGVIVRSLGWRWIFYVNLPFGLAAMLLVATVLHEKVERKEHRLDWAGALLLTLGIGAVLLAARGGRGVLAWPVALLALAAFVRVERGAAEPILPVELFQRRSIAVASVAGTLVGASMMSLVTFVPLFVQGLAGGTPTEAGATIAPMVIGWPIASAIAGAALPRVGFRPLIRVGFAITAVAAVALALTLHPGADLARVRWLTGAFGLGLGFANTALLIGVQTSVEWHQRGVATASTLFARSVGGMLGVGVFGQAIAGALGGAGGASAEAASALLGPDHGASLSREVFASLGAALGGALGHVFVGVAVVAVVAFAVGLLFPQNLHQPSARSGA